MRHIDFAYRSYQGTIGTPEKEDSITGIIRKVINKMRLGIPPFFMLDSKPYISL